MSFYGELMHQPTILENYIDNAFLESVLSPESFDESILVEYTGNEYKNQQFIEILQELDELCNAFAGSIERYDKALSSMLDTIAAIKTDSQLKAAAGKVTGYLNDFREADKKAYEGLDGGLTWKRFKSTVKSFNNKYSSVTMEEKKKLAKKIAQYAESIDKHVDPWCKGGDKVKKVIDLYKPLSEIDPVYTDKIYDIIEAGCSEIVKETNATYSDMNYILYNLSIARTENSLAYKIINKLFK